MSLSLLQSYSSAEEEEEPKNDDQLSSSSSSLNHANADTDADASSRRHGSSPGPPSSSPLPSALDAFSEISGPPEFLNNCIEGGPRDSQKEVERRGRKRHIDKKDIQSGIVVEAKAQLVPIQDRVRSDVGGNGFSPNLPMSSEEGKLIASASNPDAKDAAELLRMCMQCGVPKTYSHARGIVCPICGDRPPLDPNREPEKRKGSLIKDKEKSKRMKGQSSHATWKSESEMQLRQQFD